MYSRRYKSHKLMQVVENSYMPNLNYWHLMWYKMMLVVAFEVGENSYYQPLIEIA